ncbi:hypothetical protein NC653_000825 [Populus alba x Populus x berolinensis]|uniref:Uncharacterized protein n=1 Tax=Populus alba x Populus x berolinensis TaxID=444605 RepID=A0AAD6RJT6_9ROSI|nr:hypothetical protein NC653_000825 [Populus alba x Populus x berolinensis]
MLGRDAPSLDKKNQIPLSCDLFPWAISSSLELPLAFEKRQKTRKPSAGSLPKPSKDSPSPNTRPPFSSKKQTGPSPFLFLFWSHRTHTLSLHRLPKPAFSVFTDMSSSSSQNKSHHFQYLTQSFLLHHHRAAHEDPATPLLFYISFNQPRNQPKDSSPTGHSPRFAPSPPTEREQPTGPRLRQDTNRPPTAAQTGWKPRA